VDQALFHDATLQHPNDESDHSLVSYSVTQKLDRPFVIDRAEKSSDIGLYDVIDPFLLDRPSKCIQTLVLAASWSVSIAAVFEYGLVDRFQRPLDRLFDNLVFEIADA
jgi:hypothetical protein